MGPVVNIRLIIILNALGYFGSLSFMVSFSFGALGKIVVNDYVQECTFSISLIFCYYSHCFRAVSYFQ